MSRGTPEIKINDRRVKVQTRDGLVTEVFEAFYMDHRSYYTLVLEEANDLSLVTREVEDPEEVLISAYTPSAEEQEAVERSALQSELDAKGITYHPSCTIETLKGKLEA